MFNANGPAVTLAAAANLSATQTNYEIWQAEYNKATVISINLVVATSLVGGAFWAEGFDYTTNLWTKIPQRVTLLATTSGTPAVANGNTASTTAIINGVASNASGITNITDVSQILIMVDNWPARVRLATQMTSGTGTFTATALGFREFLN